MMKRSAKSFLFEGTEVIDDEFRVAHVDQHYNSGKVILRYHSPPWPFAEIGIKQRCQVHEIPVEYPDAFL